MSRSARSTRRDLPVDVAVAIVRDPEGRVLMAERTARQVSAGFWELPGGKVDPGETPLQAAARELQEEVGLTAQRLRPWVSYEHVYPTRRLRLYFFRVDAWTGTPRGHEGQRIAWVDPAQPEVSPVLPSIERVLTGLALPPLAGVADAARGGGDAVLGALQRSLRAGLRLVLLRAPLLAPDQRIALARRVSDLARRHGARTVLTGSAHEAARAGIAALHTPSADLARLQARPAVGFWMASCHDAAGLRQAIALGADAAVASPILPCARHPERAPLGWEGLKQLVATSTIPVFAQGGLSRAHLPQALTAGACGIMSAAFAADAAVRG